MMKWVFLGIWMAIGAYCTYKLMKSASDADDKAEIMRYREIHK